jgi:hypothetical protein
MVASSQHFGTVFAFNPFNRSRVLAYRPRRAERSMAMQVLVKRVDSVEERVTRLEELPARIDALTLQVSQLRDEMHVEFSAVRHEMHAEFSAVRGEIRAGDEETRRTLREEIRTGLDQVMTQARVLHEDQKAALALISEGRRSRSKRQPSE